MKPLFTLLLCCFITGVFAQTPQQIESDLLKSFKKIDYWNGKRGDTTLAAYDSLEKANDVFGKRLKRYCEKYPSTISNPFNSLVKEHMDITNSTDGQFRIYSWDTWTGGTMHLFENVMQYRSGQKTVAVLDTPKSGDDYVNNYRKMYTFKANNKSYYLTTYLIIGSTKDVAEGVHFFTIENGKLQDAKLIKTHSGLHSDLSYGYNFFSVVDIAYEKRPTIRFDSAASTIYLPLVDGDQNVTNKFILYKFTGRYFERVKN